MNFYMSFYIAETIKISVSVIENVCVQMQCFFFFFFWQIESFENVTKYMKIELPVDATLSMKAKALQLLR